MSCSEADRDAYSSLGICAQHFVRLRLLEFHVLICRHSWSFLITDYSGEKDSEIQSWGLSDSRDRHWNTVFQHKTIIMGSFRIITGMTTEVFFEFFLQNTFPSFPFPSLSISVDSYTVLGSKFQLSAKVCAELKCQIKSRWISYLHSSARLYFREIFATEPELPRSYFGLTGFLGLL